MIEYIRRRPKLALVPRPSNSQQLIDSINAKQVFECAHRPTRWSWFVFLLLLLEYRDTVKRFVSLQFFNLLDSQ
jgi:hypothetical protein